jgi:amidase
MERVDHAPSRRRASKLRQPTRQQIETYAASLHLLLSPEELDQETAEVAALVRPLERLEELEEPVVPAHRAERDPGRSATRREDPFNAIIRFCEVRGSETGPLAGVRVAVKDNIAVAGVPMTNGSRESSVVPHEDAVVVERLLAAGASIVAKTNLFVSDFGITRNPRDPRFFSGGSSSGSAAAVAARMVDAALGADQGGSIRAPAAWCGVVGMKATHGLVPSYGLTYWDHTLDHVGPLTATVEQNAAILEVIAGADWRDPQWVRADPVADQYVQELSAGIRGLRVGVVTESFSGCSESVATAFAKANEYLRQCGAEPVQVSIPLWGGALTIWRAILTHAATGMRESLGQGYGHLGRANADSLMEAAKQRRLRPSGGRTLALAHEHICQSCLGLPYARAQNLRLELRRQVDAALADLELLVTPTTVCGPVELEAANTNDNGTLESLLERLHTNTVVLNLTGHPALTVPCGVGDHDLPGGVQIIGRRFDEATVYRAGFALEAANQALETRRSQDDGRAETVA